MRKLLLSSVVLSTFAIALTIFQMSCQKQATAQQTNSNYTLPAATTSTLGGVIIGNGLSVTNNGTLSVNTSTSSLPQMNKLIIRKFNYKTNSLDGIYIANYDGSNQQKINVQLPSGDNFGQVLLSPDGKTLFIESNGEPTNLYSCNIDGTNLKKILGEGVYDYDIQVAY